MTTTISGPVVISTCEEEVEAAVRGDGEGYLYAINKAQHEPSTPCTRTACDEAAPSRTTIPWPAHLREVGGAMSLHVTFCLRNMTTAEGTVGTPCEIVYPVTQESNPHRQSLNAEAGVQCTNLPAGAATFYGHWLVSAYRPRRSRPKPCHHPVADRDT